MQPGTTQSAAPNNGSAGWTNAFDSDYVEVYSPAADVFVLFAAAAPTAAATNYPVPMGIPTLIRTGSGNKYGAVYCSASVTVYATPMK
jgi:hypothetical protein